MSILCPYCNALKFPCEPPRLCCSSGNIKLPQLSPPPEPLASLISGIIMSTTPPTKKLRSEIIVSNQEQIFNHVIQQLIVIHNSFNEKVKYLETKIDNFILNIKDILTENLVNEQKTHCCDQVLEKLSRIERIVLSPSYNRKVSNDRQSSRAPVVLVPTHKPKKEVEKDSTIQVITLNSEADYPNGSWLGNEKNPEARVRVPITPSQLLHINTVCTTPEKMAIVLLDYLFTQETQAKSNLSGKGKHFKEQLDPLKIYGIKTHLLFKFNITERDWYRIKQNIDSKCRTAWRKKAMGLPLTRNRTKPSREPSPENILRGSSIVLAGHFITEDNSQEFSSMIVEDKDCYTLTGCEQTLTIITDSGEVDVPIPTEDDTLTVDHGITEEILELTT